MLNFDDFDIEEIRKELINPHSTDVEYYNRFIGRKVRISHSSEYYGESESNPANIDGVIYNINSYEVKHNEKGKSYVFDVYWDNGNKNGYRVSDIYLV